MAIEYGAIEPHRQSLEAAVPIMEVEVEEHSARCKENIDSGDDNVSYWSLLQYNRPFRFYMLSYLTNHLGEWLTYLATISAIERIQMTQTSSVLDSSSPLSSRTSIGLLLTVRLVPSLLLSPFGGILADGRDRRQSMIVLDILGAAAATFFIVALHLESVPLLYAATFCQECFAGLYQPSQSALLPLLVPREAEMKKATTLLGMAWSTTAAFGSACGGLLVAWLGIRACFVVDGLTYLVSAALMFLVGGVWDVSAVADNSDKAYATPWLQVKGMVVDGVQYLQGAFFGGLVLLKASGTLVYGGTDVLNVSFSDRGSLQGRSARLGLMFGAVGVGCFVGPLVVDACTNMAKPTSIQRACLVGFCLISTGLLLMGSFDDSPLWLICFFTMIRSMGSAIMWVNSSLMLQKFTRPSMLGRVSSVDSALALVSEGTSAVVTGMLQDRGGLTAEQASLLLGTVGLAVLVGWSVYHLQGKGASRYKESLDIKSTASESHHLNTQTPGVTIR